MDVLVEVHDERRAGARARRSGRPSSASTRATWRRSRSTARASSAAAAAPAGLLRIAESGIEIARRTRAARARPGADALLVGTALMRDPGAARRRSCGRRR